jgi:Papain family cysteine protease
MKRLFLTLLLLPAIVLAQKPEQRFMLGLDFDDKQYNSTPMQSRFAGSKFRELPLVVSLKKWCPIPGDQGRISSCVGWSSCYGALTIMYAKRAGQTDKRKITDNAYSGLYVFNQVKKNDGYCNTGTFFPPVLEMLKKSGSCYHKDFNVSDCSTQPSDNLKKEAAPFAIKDYESLFPTEETASVKILKTKQSLAEGKPVVIGLQLKYNFMDVKKDDPVWHPDKDMSSFAGGHALTVIGYDDGKEAFEILNSWGEKWGDNGYGWVKYDDYARYCKYAFQMFLSADKATDKEKTSISGDFVFQYLLKGGGLNFMAADIRYNKTGNYYETEKKDWKVGQLFQLMTKNTGKDQYIYVFSVDADNKVNEHFPRNTTNTKEFGFNETPLVSITGAEIIIPTPESALSIGKAGTDWLVVLFSKIRIDNYEHLLEKLKGNVGEDVPTAVNHFFRKRLAEKDDVKYMPNKMSFEYAGREDAVVPLILKVKSVE